MRQQRTRSMLRAIVWVGAVTVPLATSGQAIASSLSADEIVQRSNCVTYYQGEDGRSRVSMVITDRQERERRREFTILRKNVSDDRAPDDNCDKQKFYVFFHRPADVNRTVFTVWKRQQEDDDRWLYLPALDVVKRIAARDKRSSFVGSHYFYEDITGRGLAEDDHKLVETTKDYYVLENTPKDPQTVEFSVYRSWIHRQTFVPVKVEFFDRNGDKYRVYETKKVEYVQDFPTITESRMQDLRSGGETVVRFDAVRYGIGLPEQVFNERYLRHPPKQYLR